MIRRLFASTMLGIIATSFCLAQESLYIQQLNTVESFPKAPILRGAFSASNLVAVTSFDKTVKIYDGTTLAERLTITGVTNRVGALSFSESGRSLATTTADGVLSIWNTQTGALDRSFTGFPNVISISVLDENLVFILGIDRTVKIYDSQSGKALGSVSSKDELTALSVHPQGRVFAVASVSGEVRIYTIAQLAMTNVLPDAKEKITALAFSRDGKYLAAGSANGNVFLWDATGLMFKGKLSGQKQAISTLAFDQQTRWVVSASFDSTLKFFNLATLGSLNTITEAGAYYSVAAFVSGEILCAANTKGNLRTWRVLEAPPDSLPPTIVINSPAAGREPTKVFAKDYEIKGIVYDDSDLKEVTVQKSLVKLIALTAAEEASVPKGFKGKKFSVIAKLNTVGQNSIEIAALDKANHFARQLVAIQRLSDDEAVELASPANNSETDKITVKVQFKPWFEVASYSISVNLADLFNNQQPPYGQKAGDVLSEDVPLVAGYNQIQLTIKSKDGERFSKTVGVTRKGTFTTTLPSSGTLPGISGKKETSIGPQRWAVVVGISEYANSNIPKLQFADRDAQAFAEFLRTEEGGKIDTDHMRVLINQDATVANVQDALYNFLGQAIDKDFVVIYFAGHGAPEPARPTNTYLLTHDANPSQLATTAFPMFRIKEVLERYITSKKVVVLSDACHSGAISVDFATRGLGVTEENRFNEYLADLAKAKEGTIVFTASAAGEVSQEFPDLGHGAFTYYLLEGMRGKADLDNDYTVTINELMLYVEEQVKRRTRGAQNPTRSQTDYDKDLPVSFIQH
ncbi:MAG: caspase family protein [Ignavibacteriales bacterium]|nr:caspase family protein [Ignavibacteriales bacterium]